MDLKTSSLTWESIKLGGQTKSILAVLDLVILGRPIFPHVFKRFLSDAEVHVWYTI